MNNHMKRLGLGTAVAMLALALLAGRSEAGMKMHNGLNMHNGLKVHNGLNMHNGLSSRSDRGSASVWRANGIDPRVPLAAARK